MILPEPKERTLLFTEQVDQQSIGKLSKSIIEINESDEELKKIMQIYGFEYNPKPIKIYIDSYGGYVYQCFGLLGLMSSSKTPIHTIVTGVAMSCGFMISISGHERFAYNKATFLYHQMSAGEVGKLKEMEEGMIENRRLQKMIEDHVLAYTNITKTRLKESFDKKEDWYITVAEAKKLGIIDGTL